MPSVSSSSSSATNSGSAKDKNIPKVAKTSVEVGRHGSLDDKGSAALKRKVDTCLAEAMMGTAALGKQMIVMVIDTNINEISQTVVSSPELIHYVDTVKTRCGDAVEKSCKMFRERLNHLRILRPTQ